MKLHRPLIHGVAKALREIIQANKSAGKVIESLLKSNRTWGSRDRAFVAEDVYDMVRWWRLVLAVDGRALINDRLDDAILVRLIGVNLILKKVELPDWEEFKRVVNGHGPASALRLQTRKMAHDEGRWVREALAAAGKRPISITDAFGG